jgi:cytochrome c peroxidase
MNADLSTAGERIQKMTRYKMLLEKAFPATGRPANDSPVVSHPRSDHSITIDKVAIAVAAYIRTLFPMSSAFDRYIAGQRKAMTADQISGFNLFMGKAQCGTCHFAPLFNGLTPPLYGTTEYEVLGVPRSDDLGKPVVDDDSGRFSVYPMTYYTRAFKTPTLRNTAVTGPWMHNGSFHSLTKVMDFYNKGGGKGLGMRTPEQTLSSQPLGLSPREIGQIKSFLSTLTDSATDLQRH